MPYCSNCGKWHEITIGGCPNTWIYSPVTYDPPILNTWQDYTLEGRLDKIIDLLTQILVKVGK